MYNNKPKVIIADMKNCQIRKDTDVKRLPRMVMRVYCCSYSYNSRPSWDRKTCSCGYIQTGCCIAGHSGNN